MWPALDLDNQVMMILKNVLMWSNISSRYEHIAFQVYKDLIHLSSGLTALEPAGLIYKYTTYTPCHTLYCSTSNIRDQVVTCTSLQ